MTSSKTKIDLPLTGSHNRGMLNHVQTNKTNNKEKSAIDYPGNLIVAKQQSLVMKTDSKKETQYHQVRDANGWLHYVLDDFVEGKTNSVSGNANASRLFKALAILDRVEAELRRQCEDS